MSIIIELLAAIFRNPLEGLDPELMWVACYC